MDTATANLKGKAGPKPKNLWSGNRFALLHACDCRDLSTLVHSSGQAALSLPVTRCVRNSLLSLHVGHAAWSPAQLFHVIATPIRAESNWVPCLRILASLQTLIQHIVTQRFPTTGLTCTWHLERFLYNGSSKCNFQMRLREHALPLAQSNLRRRTHSAQLLCLDG